MEKPNERLEDALRAALARPEQKPPELDGLVSARLYQRQAALERRAHVRRVSVWYVPMLLNLLACGVLALAVNLAGLGLAGVVAQFCLGWWAVCGVALSVLGVRLGHLKELLTFYLPRRGAKEAV